MTFTDFYEAWKFLESHPLHQDNFLSCLEIDVVKVNPENETIEKDKNVNTSLRVWLEFGPWENPENLNKEIRKTFPQGLATHDIDLDTGGKNFEEAVVKLANKVLEKYGDYKRESA